MINNEVQTRPLLVDSNPCLRSKIQALEQRLLAMARKIAALDE